MTEAPNGSTAVPEACTPVPSARYDRLLKLLTAALARLRASEEARDAALAAEIDVLLDEALSADVVASLDAYLALHRAPRAVEGVLGPSERRMRDACVTACRSVFPVGLSTLSSSEDLSVALGVARCVEAIQRVEATAPLQAAGSAS